MTVIHMSQQECGFFLICLLAHINELHITDYANAYGTEQKIEFSIMDFFSKCVQVRSFLHISACIFAFGLYEVIY